MSNNSTRTTGLDRRSFLKTVGAAGAVLGSAGAVSAGDFGGDDGNYEAPSDWPMISTRGHFNEYAQLVANSSTGYYGEGNWAKYDFLSDEIIVVVHGFSIPTTNNTDADVSYTTNEALNRHNVDEFVVGYTWDADVSYSPTASWLVANSIAEQNGAKLAAWITNWNNNGGRPVQLIGHSLGARVVCSALNTLRTWNYSNAVEKVVLLGAAIEDDEIETDDLYGLGVQQAAYNCSNFYKTDDQVLDKAYGIAELDSALGQWGIQNASQSPYNYQQLNVTNSVTDHNSYYEPYEGCIDEVASVVWGV